MILQQHKEGLIFFIVPFIQTQFMSNRGTMLIYHPIAIATCAATGSNPIGLMILIQSACLSAYMTPSATSAIPYIMGYGGYDQKTMIKISWPPVADVLYRIGTLDYDGISASIRCCTAVFWDIRKTADSLCRQKNRKQV